VLRRFFSRVVELLRSGRAPDEDFLLELEESLIAADVSATLAAELVANLRSKAKRNKIAHAEELEQVLRADISALLGGAATPGEPVLKQVAPPPTVYLIVGVNGTGKTTTIAKLARRAKVQGKRVLLAAADTFRAAAIDQLVEWGRRLGAEVIAHQPGADPAAVVFDALKSAQARRYDLLLVDTAGRLHTKKNLMTELNKMARVVQREQGRPADEILLVLDAATGQNAIRQAREFREVVGLSGVILTKMDGTAKGGAVLSVVRELGVPIKWLGTGERLDDLEEFDASRFSAQLFS